MGIFKGPERESAADKAFRKDIEDRKKEELRFQREQEEKLAYQKKRKAKGLVGSRSMFTRAGGRGFEYEGEEI